MAKWLIDTNILCHWLMSNRVLEPLIAKYKLSDDFHRVYKNRYCDSCDFLEEIRNHDDGSHLFYMDELSISELFSAIRNEVRAIVLFVKGVPLAKWANEREFDTGSIDENLSKDIVSNTLKGIDTLVEAMKIDIIESHTAASDRNYLEIFSSLVFLYPRLRTQDAMLLCSAALEQTDYFVTADTYLVHQDKTLSGKLKLSICKPSTARNNLRSETKNKSG